MSSSPIVDFLPADCFTLEQLTHAYNQTRIDYLIPMPMNAQRLGEYIEMYDISLPHSVVAVDQGEIIGLGMLGVRENQAWYTRLGVLPNTRRGGVGAGLMNSLIHAAEQLNRHNHLLEVIKNNTPAHQLFLKCGFREVRELLVLRRPPGMPAISTAFEADWFEGDEVARRLAALSIPLAWTNQPESLTHVPAKGGLEMSLPDGSSGWLIFQRHKWNLSHIVVHTLSGDPAAMARELLTALYIRFPNIDTYAENLASDDPHLPGFWAVGFIEAFRRIEMIRTN